MGKYAKDWGALLMSAIALVVSISTYFREPERDSDKMTSEIIRQTYSDFVSLTTMRVQNPRQSHLFELPEAYAATFERVKLSTNAPVAPSEIARLSLEERAFADVLFTVFEQAFFQWTNAIQRKDTARAGFLELELEYFCGRLLRNPRLLWFWAEDGGRLALHYEEATRRHYDKCVQPKAHTRDAVGPFDPGNRSSQAAKSSPSRKPQ